MNPTWSITHSGGTFLLPSSIVQNNFNTNSVSARLIATPLSINTTEQQGRTADHPQHQITVSSVSEDKISTPQQILDNVTVSFPSLRQVPVDLITNWAEAEHQATNLPQHASQSLPNHNQQQQQSVQPRQLTSEIHSNQQAQQTTTSNTFNATETDVSSTVTLQQIQQQLETELDIVVNKSPSSSPKRKRNPHPMPETWKKNVRKTKRSKGESYLSSSGKQIPAKTIKSVDCSRCRLHCTEHITEKQRQIIFESYWATASYVRQRDFLCSHIIEEEKASSTVKGESSRKREWTRQYWLPKKSGKLVRVCKTFFLATLDVGCKTIDYALKKRKGGFFCDDDQRGKHVPSNKVTEDKLDFIREHIDSFWALNVSPTKKRKNGRLLLPHDYNIRRMYKLYKEKAIEKQQPIQKEHVYRRVINMEYNISFKEPPKKVSTGTTGETSKFESPISSTQQSVILKTNEAVQQNITKPIETIVQIDPVISNQQQQHIIKERNKPVISIESQRIQQPQLQLPGNDQTTSLQHVLSQSVPPYSSAPFVLQSNPNRPLDGAVNMSMSHFQMHPSFISHHPHPPTN